MAGTSTVRPRNQAWKAWLTGGVVALALALGAGAMLRSARTSPPKSGPSLHDLRAEVTALAFPVSKSASPPGLSSTYDASKDRTRLVLESHLPAGTATGFGSLSPVWRLTSEFKGHARDPAKPELSVECRVSVVTGTPGALAPGQPPAAFEVDGVTLEAKPAVQGETPYKVSGTGALRTEVLQFRIRTADLVAICAGNNVKVRLGALAITLRSEDLAALREFAARMNPAL